MTVRSSDCEVEINGRWQTATIGEALRFDRSLRKRCLECHGPVRAHGTGATGNGTPHFEHLARHSGCSRCDAFDGKRSRHPDALK